MIFTKTTCLKILLLLLLSFQDSYANDMLSQITTHLVKTPIVQGQFQQEKRLKVLRKPLLSTGSFIYHQSKGVIWKTLTPVPSLLLINEAHLLTGQGEQALPPVFGGIFKALLGGEINRLSENFDITGKDHNASWQLQLTPKDDLVKKIIRTIVLTGNTELASLELQEINGNLTHINFVDMSHPDHLTNEQQADFERLSP